jgi:hypothetical protein
MEVTHGLLIVVLLSVNIFGVTTKDILVYLF